MENITSEIFGQRLSQRMKERGVKQKPLAEAVGIAQSAISNYCSGKRIPPMEEALKIADFLEVDVKWLLAWKEGKGELREKFTAAYERVENKPAFSEEELQEIFSRLTSDPVRLEFEAIRHTATLLTRRIDELGERLFPKPKPLYGKRKGEHQSKTPADQAAEKLGRLAAEEVRKSSS